MTSLREAFGDDDDCPCEPGNYCEDSKCTPCSAGTYSDSAGATECTDCAAGTYNNLEGAPYCLVCPKGQWSSVKASECTDCPAGETSSADRRDCVEIQCSADHMQADGTVTQVGDPVACSGPGESGNTGTVTDADTICPSEYPYCDFYFTDSQYGSCKTAPSNCDDPIKCSSITSCPSDSGQVGIDSCGGFAKKQGDSGCFCTHKTPGYGKDGYCCIKDTDWDAGNWEFYCAEDRIVCSADYLQADGTVTQVGGAVACSQDRSVTDADKICPSKYPYCDGYIKGKTYGSCQKSPSACK